MMIITEWAKQHPLLTAFMIIGFFVLIFGVSVLLILMLAPKNKKNKIYAETQPIKEIKEKEIIYKNTIHNFASNALNVCVSMGAPYAIANEQAVDTIKTDPKALTQAWKIKSKNALLNCLEQIRTVGSRRVDEIMIAAIIRRDNAKVQKFINTIGDETDKKILTDIQSNQEFYKDAPILAWDVIRAVMLIRSGASDKVGYLSEDEARDYLLQMVEPIYRLGADWKTVGKGFLAGRRLWQLRKERSTDGMKNVIELLLNNKNSPWLKQKKPTYWPKKNLEAPIFSPQDFDIMLEKYFLKDNIGKDDYTRSFKAMIEEASIREIACFMNSFRYGLNYLSAGPLREIGHNLGLSQTEVRALSIAIMMGGMRVLSSLENNIDHTMNQVADDIFEMGEKYLTIDASYLKLDTVVQEMVIDIFDVAEKRDENLWGLIITIEELQAARDFGQSSYPERLSWEELPEFSGWVEQKLYS